MAQPKQQEPPGDDPIRSPKWCAADVGVNVSTLWRWQQAGLYPAFVQLGPSRVGQRLSVHEDWKRSRPKAAPRKRDEAAA